MKIKLLLASLLTTMSLSALTVGETPKNVTISTENGGNVADNTPWNSSTIKDKVFVMFYVDPDEKDVNEHYSKALKAKNYRANKNFASIAIVNMAATWKPNFVIEKILASKQKEFPKTTYVKDKASVLVKEWDLADDASNVIIFDKTGKVLFYKNGAMSDEDTQKSFEIIEANL
jgi:hypothetical protein